MTTATAAATLVYAPKKKSKKIVVDIISMLRIRARVTKEFAEAFMDIYLSNAGMNRVELGIALIEKYPEFIAVLLRKRNTFKYAMYGEHLMHVSDFILKYPSASSKKIENLIYEFSIETDDLYEYDANLMSRMIQIIKKRSGVTRLITNSKLKRMDREIRARSIKTRIRRKR